MTNEPTIAEKQLHVVGLEVPCDVRINHTTEECPYGPRFPRLRVDCHHVAQGIIYSDSYDLWDFHDPDWQDGSSDSSCNCHGRGYVPLRDFAVWMDDLGPGEVRFIKSGGTVRCYLDYPRLKGEGPNHFDALVAARYEAVKS